MEVRANLSYLRIAPRKVRLVANLIKGMTAARAELELRHLPKRSAEPLLKLLRSGVANATHNFEFSKEGLYIKEIRVDPGPVSKRFQPRAFGRAAPIRKRTSHVALILGTQEEAKSGLRKRSRKEEPVVREIAEFEPEEMGGQIEAGSKKGKRPEASSKRIKPTDFVRRMFRRKAI